MLEGNQNKNNCLGRNFYDKLKSPARAFLPPVSHVEKYGKFHLFLEIAHRAFTYSYFDLPLTRIGILE